MPSAAQTPRTPEEVTLPGPGDRGDKAG